MPKSKDAFRTISEVADWLETPAHVLRFWESKFTQVKPVKRAGGRRYYRPADMLLLGGIKKLLHDDGLTIKGAQKLLREHGVKHVSGLSQPLDDDLAEDIVEEAAFEADAQPAPEAEITPTVVSFPSRAEPPAPVAEAPTAADAEAAAPEQPAENAEEDREESTAFGKDALPAFLRRTAPERKDAAPEGLTIDPVAKLVEPEMDPEPVTEDTGAEETTALEEDTPQPIPSAPVFSHSADLPKTAQAVQSPDGDDAAEDTAQRAAPKVDVPSIAKIAPELSSFEAKPGVLASLPGAKRLSPELAAEMHSKLTELRALRDRMQG